MRVVSDEIHCELVMPGCRYTPFAAVSDDCQNNSIALSSPSKSFNTAGLQMANIVCNDAETRRRINRALNINEVCDVNPFGPIALEAAYNGGEEWLEELNQYLYQNYLTLRKFFEDRLPQLGLRSDELTERLLKEGKVLVNSGTMYGKKAGEGYIRINIACPRSRMLEGLERIAAVLSNNTKE